MADQREQQIAIMGNKKSGKTSIARVVFQKMSVNETWFIESTNRVEVIPIQNNPYTKFSLLDFPGTFDPMNMSSQEKKHLESCAMIIYVLDAQDEPYNAALQKLVTIMTKAGIPYDITKSKKVECRKLHDWFVENNLMVYM